MALSETELKPAMVKGRAFAKEGLITLNRPTSPPSGKLPVVKAHFVLGKTGAELAKALHLSGALKADEDLTVFLMTGLPQAGEVELPGKVGTLSVFPILKSPGFKKIGPLRGDEKYPREIPARPAPRAQPSSPKGWRHLIGRPARAFAAGGRIGRCCRSLDENDCFLAKLGQGGVAGTCGFRV